MSGGTTVGTAPLERLLDVPERRGSAPATTLAVRVHGPSAPAAGTTHARRGSALLVHGLASNARMWDACAAELARAGVGAVAVDLRGHGRSAASGSATGSGSGSGSRSGPYDTGTAAGDVAAVAEALLADGTLTAPVVLAGQSWGGNVVLAAAADRAPVDALALVDGGWIRFDPDEPFDRLWARLAPPTWDGTTWDELTARLTTLLQGWGPHALPAVLANLTTDADGAVRNVLPRAAHEQILRSMYDGDPRRAYPHVAVPVLLVPAGDGPAARLVEEAATGLPDAVLRRYDDAHHDLHLQHPARLAADLLDLLGRVDAASAPAASGLAAAGASDPPATTDREHR